MSRKRSATSDAGNWEVLGAGMFALAFTVVMLAAVDPPWHYLGQVEGELVSIGLRGRNSVGVIPVRLRLPSGMVIEESLDLNLAGGLRKGDRITLHAHRSLLFGRHTYDGAIPSRYLPAKSEGGG